MEQMAAFLRRYEQDLAMTKNVFRYAGKVSSVEACPGVFGMDFAAMEAAPDSEKPNVFLAQETRAGLLRRLMAGETVEDSAMKAAFGFTAGELADCRKAMDPIRKPIPEDICVLCFDDAYKSQRTVAMPILQELGFQATFFIAEMEKAPHGATFEDKNVFMTWEEIKELQDAGFELGNHSLHHVHGSQNMGRDFNIAQIRGMEQEFARHGLDKPVTYAYPSGISNPDVVSFVRECGYKWARGNQEKGGGDGIRGMTYYDPLVDSPLAICNHGDPDFYTEEILRQRIRETPRGCIFGLTYHDVGEAGWLGPISFRRQMEILKETGRRVISIRQLEEFIDPEKAYQYAIG